jgi:glycosyltransferase involved in cell wall biosynthesis/GT2 family glycosyltransferase
MKVANFTDTYLPHTNGVATALYAMHHAKKGWEDDVFTPIYSKGTHHVRMNKVASLPFPAPNYRFAISISGIRNKAKGCDIIHIHTPYNMFYYSAKCARELMLPLVGTFHTDPPAFFGGYISPESPVGKLLSRFTWWWFIKMYNECDAVIAPSEQIRDELLELGLKRPLYVVYNGVDTKRFDPKLRTEAFLGKYGIPKGKKLVFFVGRLESRKRPYVFVKADLESKSDAVFVVVGSGNMRSSLEKMAKGRKNIIFTGFLSDEMLPQAFAAADVFVMPSEKETQGIVILEAMASGCAVVSTDAGAAREMLGEEHLFARGDYKGLAKRVDAILSDTKHLEAVKKQNRARAVKDYSMEICLSKLDAIYQKVYDDFNNRMKVSVVVPTLNEIRSIGKCLSSIKNQTYKNVELLIADGGSTDGTIEFAGKYGRVVHCGKTGGPGPARNIAARQSSGEIVAFTDADTGVPWDWIKRIVYNFCSDPDLIGVGGVLRPLDPRPLDRIVFKINSDWFYRLTSSFGFHQLATPNCAYRKDAFLKVGGFDETLSMFEDTDLSIRMSKKGKIKMDKNLYVYNSTRRIKKEGYVGLFFRYLKVYILYFSGKPIRTKYFDTIQH